MLSHYLLAFISGILIKAVDHIEDEEKKKHWIRWPLAILSGIVLGYLISTASFSMILLGGVIAQIIIGKVDTVVHRINYLFILFSMLYFGLPQLLFLPLAAFVLFASLDELDKLIFWKKPEWVQEFRPFLELAAIPFFFIGQWQFLVGIVAFDIGYVSMKILGKGEHYKLLAAMQCKAKRKKL